MTENFEFKGEWYLPGNPKNRVSGTLYFKNDTGIYLELFGDLSATAWDVPIILGLTNNSRSITLYKCRANRIGGLTLRKDGEVGIPSTEYSISFIFEGKHFSSERDLRFTRITSELYNLPEWVGKTGFQEEKKMERALKRLKGREIRIDYKLPNPINFKINDKVNGIVNFTVNNPGASEYVGSKSINQKVQIIFKFNQPETLEMNLSYLFAFQKFLMLALYGASYPYNINLMLGEDGKEERVKFYFPITRKMHIEKPQMPLDMLFSLAKIRPRFSFIMRKWFAMQDKLEPAYDLLIEHLYNRSEFTVNTFLNLAQAAETYHARTHNHTKMPKKKYENMKEAIYATTTAKYHPWLKDQFNFGNSMNLHSRLTETVNKFSFPIFS